MKKILFVTAFTFALTVASFSQSNKNLDFCKYYFRAEGLLQLALKYKDDAAGTVFSTESNKAASRAESTLTEIEPTIKSKLTKQELEDLKKAIKVIQDKTAEGIDDNSVAAIVLWLQLSDRKFANTFQKLMK